MRYDENGHYVSVEEVNWFVENGTLKRSCRTLVGAQDEDDCKNGSATDARGRAVEIATGITKFVVTPALPGVKADEDAQVFPPCVGGSCSEEFRLVSRSDASDYSATVISYSEDHKTAELSGFVTNYDKTTNTMQTTGKKINQGASWKNLCRQITLEPQTEYELSFSLADGGVKEQMRMFVPGRDFMAVGFRYATNGEKPVDLDDFLFYPPTDEKAAGTRAMRFSVREKITKACIAFSFVSYSPIAANGSVTISDLRLKKVESANYKFDYPEGALTLKDKANVKAMRLVFGVQRNGEEGTDSLIVRTPSNGMKD